MRPIPRLDSSYEELLAMADAAPQDLSNGMSDDADLQAEAERFMVAHMAGQGLADEPQ